jgi:hypothetical protein
MNGAVDLPKITKVTPAVSGILDMCLADKLLIEYWQQIAKPSRDKEARICLHAFRAYAATGGNKRAGLMMFLGMIESEGFSLLEIRHDDKVSDQFLAGLGNLLVPKEVFDVYWNMAKEKQYWNEYPVFDRHKSYNEVLERWERQKEDVVQFCWERIEQWSSVN